MNPDTICSFSQVCQRIHSPPQALGGCGQWTMPRHCHDDPWPVRFAHDSSWFQTPFMATGQSPEGCSVRMFRIQRVGRGEGHPVIVCGLGGLGFDVTRCPLHHVDACIFFFRAITSPRTRHTPVLHLPQVDGRPTRQRFAVTWQQDHCITDPRSQTRDGRSDQSRPGDVFARSDCAGLDAVDVFSTSVVFVQAGVLFYVNSPISNPFTSFHRV